VRFLSCEPLLEDVSCVDLTDIDWVIAGGESGHHARDFQIEWARALRDRCAESHVAFFLKQLGSAPTEDSSQLVMLHSNAGKRDIHGKNPLNFPDDLLVQQWPASKTKLIPLTNKLQEAMNLTPLRAFLRALRNRSYVAPVVTSSGYPAQMRVKPRTHPCWGQGPPFAWPGGAQAGVAGSGAARDLLKRPSQSLFRPDIEQALAPIYPTLKEVEHLHAFSNAPGESWAFFRSKLCFKLRNRQVRIKHELPFVFVDCIDDLKQGVRFELAISHLVNFFKE